MTFKLYLATARDTRPFEGGDVTYAFHLVDDAGSTVSTGETSEGTPLPPTVGDPAYVALLECLPEVPENSDLHVVCAIEYLTGKEEGQYPYPGVLNETPHSRIEARYRKGKKKKEVFANLSQLRAIDTLLMERAIRTSCKKPTLEEDDVHRAVSIRAKQLLAYDPNAPISEDY